MKQESPAVSKFGKHENEPKEVNSPGSDWRWGLVVVEGDGKPRYSPLQRGAAGRLDYRLSGNEKEVWLAVTATPKVYQPIVWDQMYYTIYRYPWAVEITGATPQGSGPAVDFTNRRGAAHPNGGGWVDATAKVDATAFVAPGAAVLDQAVVSGRARINGSALVSGRARVEDDAVLTGRALVTGGSVVSGKAAVSGDAAVFDGTITGEADIGALTIIEGAGSRFAGRVRVAAVMNTLRDVKLAGDVQLLGDIELHHSPAKGVFYGFVDEAVAGSPRWGAERTAPEPEVTAPWPAPASKSP